MFGDLRMVAMTSYKILRLSARLGIEELDQCAVELVNRVARMKISAEQLAASCDELQSHLSLENSAPCPECSRGQLRIKAKQPLPKHAGVEVHTYKCSSCPYSGAYLYRKPS